MNRVTLQDVADRAGVSMKTVSNVVRGYRHVSPGMRERVQAAIDELGYRPNRTGRSLATGRSSMLGLAFPDLRRPYFAELAHMFAPVAESRGYRLLLAETGATADGERSVLHDREAGIMDGMVMQPQVLAARDLDGLRRGMPIVFLGEDPQPASADQVAIDNVAAAREAVEHLLRLGRRRIGFLGHETDRLSWTSTLRIEGYRAALDEQACPSTRACSSLDGRTATPATQRKPSAPRSTPASSWTVCCAATTSPPSAPCGLCAGTAWTSRPTSRSSAGTR
jgi:DNA-binding LacI/PurR family transcriptional regulator